MADVRWKDNTDIATLAAADYIPITKNSDNVDYYTTPAEINAYSMLVAPTTVDFNSSMSTATIQGLIDGTRKNQGTQNLIFQFADGTYTLNAALTFYSFYGGWLSILGNATDNSLSATKAVKLNFSNNTDGIIVNNCIGGMGVQYFDIEVDTASDNAAITVNAGDGSNYVNYNYIHGDGIVLGDGVRFYNCFGQTFNNRYSNLRTGIIASWNSKVSISTSDSVATIPAYGMRAHAGATLAKIDATLPTGSTANEDAAAGE